jgi:CBS domain-containing protein
MVPVPEEEAYPYLEGQVEDVMTRDPLVVLEEESLARLVDVFARSKFHGLPVVNADYELVGVIRDTDLMSLFARKEPGSARPRKVRDIMQKPPFVIAPDETIQRAVIKMFADGTRFLVVVDKKQKNKIVGVVTRIDLVGGIRWRKE